MTDTLHPGTLKALRNKRGWSQDQLAAESKISKSQISRWERGQQTVNIRQHNRERLCAAFGVKWDKLTQPPGSADAFGWWRNRVALKAGIHGSAKTALTLIRLRYGLLEEAVIDLAPLAFLILAERSLRARQVALDEAVKALDAASDRLPYMRGTFQNGYHRHQIDGERKSIEKREVFKEYEDGGEEFSPFIDFLQKELADVGRYQKPRMEFSSNYRSAPDYEIPMESIGPVAGLDPEREDERGILERVQQGYIDLWEVIEKKRDSTEDEYRRWLTEKHQAVEAEIQSRPSLLDLDFVFGKALPDDASTSSAQGDARRIDKGSDNTETEDRA